MRAGAPATEPDRERQRAVVDGFFAAARAGDLDALVTTLDPDVVLREDGGQDARLTVAGARTVAGRALGFARCAPAARPALVNGGAGVVVAPGGQPRAILGFTVAGNRIAAIDALTDAQRLGALDLSALGPGP